MNLMASIFEIATREKYRFPYKGQVSVEDLWDIPLEGLDDIYKKLKDELNKIVSEDGLLVNLPRSNRAVDLQNMIEIVRYIFNVKLDENLTREQAVIKKAKRDRILEIMAKKQDNALENTSMEELQKMLDDLA